MFNYTTEITTNSKRGIISLIYYSCIKPLTPKIHFGMMCIQCLTHGTCLNPNFSPLSFLADCKK